MPACNYAAHHSFIYKYLKRLSTFRTSINRPSKSDPERSSITVQIAAVAIIDLHLSDWAALSAKAKVVAAGGELYDYGICAELLKTSVAAAVLMRHWAKVRNELIN